MVYGIGCGAYMIFFARIQDILNMAVSHPAVRLSSSWWRTQYDFVPSISAKPCRRHSRRYQSSFGAPILFARNFLSMRRSVVSTDHRLAHTVPGAPGI